jgi:alkylhydroperoxidase/carboxymuconolactone decarboxylase family protein YurZ
MNKSHLLINEPALQVLPSLAKAVGLEEAIVLQQLHYWLNNPKVEGRIDEDGNKWIFNTYEEWRENFPFWSVQQIQRIFLSLEKGGYVISKRLDAKKHDQTKFYRINYDALCALDESILIPSKASNSNDVNKESQRLPETTSGADAPKIPDLPLDWKIAHGEQITKTDLLSEKTRRMLDVANLIATGTGIQAEKYVAAALAFMQERDIVMPLDGVKGYRRALREMFEANVQPEHIAAAVRKLVSSGLPCVDLHSVRRTAIDIANPPRETRASQDRDVLAEIEEMERTAVPNPGRRKHVA